MAVYLNPCKLRIVGMTNHTHNKYKTVMERMLRHKDTFPWERLFSHHFPQAEQAVKAALSDYYRRQGIDPEPIVGKLEEDCDHCSGESCGV